MGKCIGNCVKCDLVSNDEKMTCCAFQTLRQAVEIRSQINSILDKLSTISGASMLSKELMEMCEAEPPAAEIQEQTSKKAKK